VRKPFIIANWKLNKLAPEVRAFCEALPNALGEIKDGLQKQFQVGIAPQTLHLDLVQRLVLGQKIEVAAQNSANHIWGAFTGEVSPASLKEMGIVWTLLGHSERRHVYQESLSLVKERYKTAVQEKLGVVLCVGEKLEERESNKTFEIIEAQLAPLKEMLPSNEESLVIAYEPVWAIGTGKTATSQQAQEVHLFIRGWMAKNLKIDAQKVRVLYGGSVKPENSAELMACPDVDGLLVGSASLDVRVFAEIIRNGLRSRF